jgi:peptide subunit release factor 1 (eRF1)
MALLVLGGTPGAIAALRQALDRSIDDARVTERPDLNFDQGDPEIQAVLEEAASAASERGQAALVTRIVETARSGGAACLGEAETNAALRERRVAHLAFADEYRRKHPDRIDALIAAAFTQDANLEEVSRAPGAQLVAEGGGVGALLHYRVSPA